MWPIAILGVIGYALWRGAQGSALPAQILTDLAAGDVAALGNDASSIAYATEDDVSSLIGGPVTTSAATILAAEAPYDAIVSALAASSGWDRNLLIGIGWQESRWGTSSLLDVQGPGGTGDFTARSPSWVAATVKNVPALAQYVVQVSALPPGWHGSGPGPWMIPADGRGWGRGLMQIDLPNAISINWPDPQTNIQASIDNLNSHEAYLKQRAPGVDSNALVTATVAAYNAGNVSTGHALLAGTDPSTPYSNNVLGFANVVASA